MVTRIKIWILFFVLLVAQAKACINEYGVDISGKEVTLIEGSVLQVSRRHKELWEENKQELIEKMKTDTSFRLRSNLGIALLHLGEVQEAIKIYEELIQQHPNEYNLHANLGTAYELAGRFEDALKYMKKAIVMNPRSHFGSEWIHVKILEAKINIKNDPKWLSNNSVLAISFGEDAKPNSNLGIDSLNVLKAKIEAQLRERIQFVYPPDAIVGELLFSLGDIYTYVATMHYARDMYLLALEYQPNKIELLEKRIVYTGDFIQKYAAKAKYTTQPFIFERTKHGSIPYKSKSYDEFKRRIEAESNQTIFWTGIFVLFFFIVCYTIWKISGRIKKS